MWALQVSLMRPCFHMFWNATTPVEITLNDISHKLCLTCDKWHLKQRFSRYEHKTRTEGNFFLDNFNLLVWRQKIDNFSLLRNYAPKIVTPAFGLDKYPRNTSVVLASKRLSWREINVQEHSMNTSHKSCQRKTCWLYTREGKLVKGNLLTVHTRK
jgi:hypothetical protein